MEVALFAKHSETQLKSSHYRCQSDGSVAQCQVDAQASVLIDYAAKNHQYTTAQFKTAVSEALELFGRKMSPTSTITRFKMWEGGDNLQLRIEWKAPTSNTPKTNFMSCHVHGAHFDCHRQAAAGPNEISN